MSDPIWGLLVTSFLPALVLVILFRDSWSDSKLVYAAVGGILGGLLAVGLMKFMAYPLVNGLLGRNLRSLIAETDDMFLKLATCIGIVGILEETGKLVGAVASLLVLGTLGRPVAVFIACLGSAVGFAGLENLDYYSLFGAEIFRTRVFVSSTAHIVFSGIIGGGAAYCFRKAPDRHLRAMDLLVLLVTILLGAVMHGIFNMVAMGVSATYSLPVLAVFLLFGGILFREMWLRVLEADSEGEDSKWICAACGRETEGGRFCSLCGARKISATE